MDDKSQEFVCLWNSSKKLTRHYRHRLFIALNNNYNNIAIITASDYLKINFYLAENFLRCFCFGFFAVCHQCFVLFFGYKRHPINNNNLFLYSFTICDTKIWNEITNGKNIVWQRPCSKLISLIFVVDLLLIWTWPILIYQADAQSKFS